MSVRVFGDTLLSYPWLYITQSDTQVSWIVSLVTANCHPNPSFNSKVMSWKGFWKEKKLTVTLTFDPKSQFSHATQLLDMTNNHTKFHRNPIPNSDVIAQRRFF